MKIAGNINPLFSRRVSQVSARKKSHPHSQPKLGISAVQVEAYFMSIISVNWLEWAGLIWLLILNGHLYLSEVEFCVDFKMDTKKTCVKKRLDSAQNLLTILDYIVNTNGGIYMIIV